MTSGNKPLRLSVRRFSRPITQGGILSPHATARSFFHIGMNGMKASDRIFAFLDLPEAEDGKAVLEEKEIRISMEKLLLFL